MPRIPQYWVFSCPVTAAPMAMNTPKAAGAMNETTRPVVA